MNAWDPLLSTGSADAVLSALRGLGEPQRADLAAALTGYLAAHDAVPPTNLAIAAVGCLPSAAAVADVLRDAHPHWRYAKPEPVLVAARERGVGWLGDLALQLAGRSALEFSGPGFRVLAELLRATGTPPPAGDAFVLGWLFDTTWSDYPLGVSPRDRLRDDPLLDALLPGLFVAEGAGELLALTGRGGDGKAVLAEAFAHLANTGRVDRRVVLDGCLDRLLAGGAGGELRGFVLLHDRLAPQRAEVRARAVRYRRLLGDAPAPVAAMAQRVLRRAAPDPGVVLDASRAVLLRPDKPLVRKQLDWLDDLATRHPGRVADVLAVLAAMAAHPALDLRDRAREVAAKHAPAAPAVTAPAVTAPAVPATGDRLPPPPAPRDLPAPITSPDELAEEFAALLGAAHIDAVPLERVLAGLVARNAADPAALRAALKPVAGRHRVPDNGLGVETPGPLRGVLGVALHVAAGSAEVPARWARALAAPREPGTGLPDPLPVRPKLRADRTRLQYLVARRIAEVALRLDHDPVPALVATPTSTNGLIDPAVLLERLRRAEREGWHPLVHDLGQALLRLPRHVEPDVTAAAAGLCSPAGRRLAAWLDGGGLPDPRATRTEATRPDGTAQVLVRLAPPPGHPDPERLLTLAVGDLDDAAVLDGDPLLWAAALPAHRDVVAACALPELAAVARTARRGGAAGAAVLPVLAECTGPLGVATAVGLAYALAAKGRPDRAAAVDALLALAAAVDAAAVDAAAVGAEIGALAAGGLVTVAPLVATLTDAADAGAPATVWRILAAALPALLTAPVPPRGTADLLTLGAATAAAAPAVDTTALAGPLAAARQGTTRLATEARRLTGVLGRP